MVGPISAVEVEMKQAEDIELSSSEGEALIERIEGECWTAEDRHLVVQIIRLYVGVIFALQEAKITVKRLRHLLFGKSPKPFPAPEDADAPSQPDGDSQETSASDPVEPDAHETPASAPESEPTEVEPATPSKPKGGHRPGTGRLGANVYEGAERVECRHDDLAAGQRCPRCGQGNLYELPPGKTIRIHGHALLSALRYDRQRLRCSACGQVFTAPLPPEAGQEKYSPQARAALAVSRYHLGLPFYRLQGYQVMLGVPVPDATQWQQIEKVGDCCYKVFAHLETLAAQGELINQDDTWVRIQSLMAQNRQYQAQAEALGLARSPERTGMFTTALVVKVGERTLCLYYSGRAHAGENLEALLRQRQAGLEKPLVMSDALSRNEVDETAVVRCHCLAHGRRQFSDLEEVFPIECQRVMEALKQVFDHEDEARDQQMSPEARLAYHQEMSRPIMDGLHTWLQNQMDDHRVDPNSALGKAMTYMQNHWETLTRFLSIPGAPLDNNWVERALKLFIRQRKNSLFFRTEHRAYIASVITTLMATCLYAGVHALDYLVALQEHRAEVHADPAAWLPWTYSSSRAGP
jgi:hypothetical protein